MKNSTYIVIGAGIVGASIGYHLARRGAQVTIVDKASSPADGATHNSFGWFSGAGGDWPGGADNLRPFVLDDYRRLEKEVPGLSVRWTGSLVCTDVSVRLNNGMQVASGQQSVAQDKIAALEPNLKQPPVNGIHSPTDGGIDPILATTALLDAAKSHGAVTIFGRGSAVIAEDKSGVFIGETFYEADTVIIAAAAGAQSLCESLGMLLPMTISPAFWLKATGPVGLVKTIFDTPEFEIRESRDGHYLMTALALHHGDESAAHQKQLAEATIKHVNERFGLAPDQVQLLDYGVCQRPMPANGPIIDYITNDKTVYVAVMHSGITLAPTVGRLIAEELTSGKRPDMLQHCTLPSRTRTKSTEVIIEDQYP